MTDSANARTPTQDVELTITDAAARRVQEIGSALDYSEAAGLRVHVVEGGCSGLNYDVQVVEQPEPDDTVYVFNNTRVFVNPFSIPHVQGLAVDWTSTFQESRFVFHNPNATGGCGCGVSFTVD